MLAYNIGCKYKINVPFGLFTVHARVSGEQGVRSRFSVTQQRERIQYICSKLERAYLLAQALYDGHKAEIDKFAASEELTASEWVKGRKHPGDVMNELKMTVRMYAPNFENVLNDVDVAHQALKSTFQKIDEQVNGVTFLSPKHQLISELTASLTSLGDNLNVLKATLIEHVHFLMTLHAGSVQRFWRKELE